MLLHGLIGCMQWLEAFVDGSNSQMQVVASGVEQIREGLGCGQSSGARLDRPQSGLVADIQRLLAENKNRDKHMEVLQAAVNGLAEVVHEDVRQNTEARNTMSESILILVIQYQLFPDINFSDQNHNGED